jgi:hypothetical protein
MVTFFAALIGGFIGALGGAWARERVSRELTIRRLRKAWLAALEDSPPPPVYESDLDSFQRPIT